MKRKRKKQSTQKSYTCKIFGLIVAITVIAVSGGILLKRTITVSYTHLDVYKRQSLYSHCTDSVIFLCRRTKPEYRKKFFKVLCSSVSGRSNRGACLHYFFTICIITASSRSGRSSSDYGVELYWRIDFQYACTGRSSEDVRQGSTGNDGIVKRTPESILKIYSTMLLLLLYRIFP